MDFEVRHRFPIPPEALWATVFSPAYERAVDEHSGFPRTVLSESREGGVRRRRVRVESPRELPPVLARALGTSRLTYEMDEVYHEDDLLMEWTVIPAVAADRVDARGTYAIVPAEGGCERVIRGSVKVSIPLVGGRIERAIGDELRSSYERNRVFVEDWLAREA